MMKRQLNQKLFKKDCVTDYMEWTFATIPRGKMSSEKKDAIEIGFACYFEPALWCE